MTPKEPTPREQTPQEQPSFLNPQTLEGKIRLLAALTVSSTLTLVLLGMIALQTITARERLLRDSEILADLLGKNGAASLAFLQVDAAERILASLEVHPDILYAEFLTPDGEVFAVFEQDAPETVSQDVPEAVSTVSPMDHVFTPSMLAVRRDIVRDQERLGEVRLVASLDRIRNRLLQSIAVVTAILVFCGWLSWRIGSRRLMVVARPVRELAAVAEQVSVSHDYGLRAPKHADDEVGRLVDRFNHMLEQIAERSRLERDNQELKRTKEELEAKNAELERFTYTVSHDLKSPLFTIQGFVGLLERDVAKGKIDRLEKNVEHIRGAADKMQLLLDDLLELSRIGRVLNPMEDASLGALVRDVCELLEREIQERNVEIVIPAELPRIYGDRQRILEVYQNLISNAVRYMGERDDARIEIEAETRGEFVHCRVRDNGIGIAPRYHEKIFGLFEVLEADGPGTGIGLALVRRIVEFHGGTIHVESALGEGSVFHFTLPSGPPIV